MFVEMQDIKLKLNDIIEINQNIKKMRVVKASFMFFNNKVLIHKLFNVFYIS